MKTVIISEQYRVQITDLNHTLEKLTEGGKNPKTREPADPRWVVEGYFPNMAQCIKRVIDLKAANTNETQTLKQHLEECKRLIEWAQNLNFGQGDRL